jgi:hypothetical protein
MAVDAEPLTIAWLLSLPGMSATVGDRVWYEIPPDPTLPFVVVQEIGGGDTGVYPVTRPYMQIDCIAAPGDPGTADAIAGIITDAARGQVMTPVPSESATVMKANWVAKRRVEEPGTGWERKAVDLLLTVREDI